MNGTFCFIPSNKLRNVLLCVALKPSRSVQTSVCGDACVRKNAANSVAEFLNNSIEWLKYTASLKDQRHNMKK